MRAENFIGLLYAWHADGILPADFDPGFSCGGSLLIMECLAHFGGLVSTVFSVFQSHALA